VSAQIVVIGGGLAGIEAALRCAEGGARVTLLEGRRWLGGSTFSRFHRGLGFEIDNGQHVFLRCCEHYLRFLERLGVRDGAAPPGSAARGCLLPRTSRPVCFASPGCRCASACARAARRARSAGSIRRIPPSTSTASPTGCARTVRATRRSTDSGIC
jgi:phytoene dehydrogenase-like protein